MFWLLLLLFVLGLIFGSFLNVVIVRSKTKKSFVSGRSECPKCKEKISWYDNIPLLSFFVLRGRCRKCGKKISMLYPLVESLTGIFFVWWFLIGFGFFRLVGSPWSVLQPLFWLVVGLMFIVIFVTDILYMIIPFGSNLFLLVWIVFYKVILVASSNMRLFDLFLGIVLGLTLAVFFWLVNYLTLKLKGVLAFGEGDIYLSPALGLLLGWPRFLVGIFLTFIFGSFFALVLLALKKKKKTDYLPFAPFLLVGSTVALLYGDVIWQWYVSFLV